MSDKLQALGGHWQPLIDSAVSQLSAGGLDLDAVWAGPEQRLKSFKRLRRLLDLVVTWNGHVDLTAARGTRELVDLYLADALVLAAHGAPASTPSTASWLDVGSGAGAPGLVLQALRPELLLTLVEPRVKRVAFLRSALGGLDLGRPTSIMDVRSNAVPDASCDVAVSRATFSPQEWLVEGARLARDAVWVLLARGAVPALPGFHVSGRVEYVWPLTGVSRYALRFERDVKTD
jgi:16S rRNA (guanine527-N7)-methyltransferase